MLGVKPAIILTFTLEVLIILALVSYGLWYNGDPLLQFDDDGLLTVFSAVQLFAVAFVCLAIYVVRLRQNNGIRLATFVWLLLASGFIFLGLDDLLRIHENLDAYIHAFFKLKETALSDRIDDAIIGIYGLAGICILYLFRNELNVPNGYRKYVKLGFIALLITVIIDAVTDRRDIIFQLFDEELLARQVTVFLVFWEEALKVFAEGAFFIAFYARLFLLHQSERMANSHLP